MAGSNDHAALFQAILSSPGMAYINRTFARSFSLNIFRRNAQELLAATHNVRDADYGLQLMAVNNREAGQQAHREINRFVHNFVASAMTLVEHTRNFMREHYEGTAVRITYDNRVMANFASEPVVQFVQSLRNYFVHKGLPNSEMFIEFQSNDSSSTGTLETGVRYKSAAFLEWDGWNAPARNFIESAGEYIDIHAFADAYVEKVLAFHQWFDGALEQFHADDLAELREMQEKHAALSRPSAGVTPDAPSGSQASDRPSSASATPSVAEYEFPTAIARAVDEAGSSILAEIRKLDFPPQPPGTFPSERPVTTITADTLVETPILRATDTNGRSVIAFITSGSDVFGLDEDVFARSQQIAEKVLEVPWARHSLSRKFIEQVAIKWLRSSFQQTRRESLTDGISTASRDEVEERDFWAPIACLEVEEKFALGSAEIAPISRAMMDQLETKAMSSASPKQQGQVAKMFADLRSKMQGLAGVRVHMKAEQTRVSEDGMAVAQNTIGILRFFSPVATAPWQVCSTALLGTEVLPRSQALVLGEQDFLFSDGSVFQPFVWRLSKMGVSDLMKRGLAKATVLISPDGLNEFQLAVRASLLLYSTSTTFLYPGDRLVYALSALEGLLLKHSMEPTEFSVEERVSLLLSAEKSGREPVARNVRDAYRFRRRHGASVLSPHDQSSLAMFIHNTYVVLCTALENSNVFATKIEFIDAVERRKADGIVESPSENKEAMPPVSQT